MRRSIAVTVSAALASALAGVVLFAVAAARHPGLTIEMDRELPRLASGFHPAERAGDLTFAWTTPRAVVNLPSADRAAEWQCTVRLRGAHPPGVAQPTVTLDIDGQATVSRTLTNDFEELSAKAPRRPGTLGLRLAIVSDGLFVPGGGDPRSLGAQVDTLTCRPLTSGLTWPSRASLLPAAGGPAAFAIALGLAGASAAVVFAAPLVIAAAQALPLSTGYAPFTAGYGERMLWLALVSALGLVAVSTLIGWRQRTPLSGAGLFAVAFSAAVIYLKLLALLHPSKPIIDAVFHAHRLEWVLAGRYYFTQPLQSGVQFPYAIGLYVFAAPWTIVTRDFVSLLRVITVVAETVAGGLLYLMVVRHLGDRVIGAIAVVLFALAPASYGVLGNANLTNAFGQSTSIWAVAAATIWPLQPRHAGQWLGLSVLIALALLSHVSTLSLLMVTLAALVLLYRFAGGPSLRGPAVSIVLATTVAMSLSVGLYYAHFGDSYRTLRNAQVPAESVPARTGTPVTIPTAPGDSVPLATRASHALAMTVAALGWPLLILGAVGAGRLAREWRNRTTLAIVAWGAAFLLFLVVTILTPVNARYARYADEFVARAVHATYPGLVVLAAAGWTTAWQRTGLLRLASAAVLTWAGVDAARTWMAWLR